MSVKGIMQKRLICYKKNPVIVLIFSEASKDKIEIQFPGRESKTNSENVFYP